MPAPICQTRTSFLKQIQKLTQQAVKNEIPEVLRVSVTGLILQQLTLDEVVAQAELRHGQYLSFVRCGVAGGAYHVIPVLSTGDALTEHQERRRNSYAWG